MAKEIYSNGAVSFLSAAVASTDTSFNVIGGVWPTTGQFTILCDTEYMLVTAVSGTSPSTFTVVRGQEGSTASAHNKSALVYLDLTAGSLGRLCRQSLNGTNISTRRELNFLGTNISLVDNPALDTCDITLSSNVIPPLTGWTLIQGTGTSGSSVTDASSITLIESNSAAAGENVKGLFRPIPTTPFKIAAQVHMTFPMLSSTSGMGIAFRESATGKIHGITVLQTSNPGITTWGWTNPNSYSGTDKTDAYPGPGMQYLQLGYDGTNLTYYISGDGINYNLFKTSAKAKFFTTAPDQIGFYIDTVNAGLSAYARLVHWKQT